MPELRPYKPAMVHHYTGPIVDAHHHVWDVSRNRHPWLRDEPMIPFRYGDYGPIRRNYLPDDYLNDLRHFDLIASVYIEAEWDPDDPIGETEWVHEIADRHGVPGAVVAQAWLDREDVADVLARQAGFDLVRGVRHKPRAAPTWDTARRGEPGSMDDPRWREGYARLHRHGLHFELQTPWWHFDAAAHLAQDFPRTRIVLNHAGLPSDRSAEGLAGWRAAMTNLAREPNVMLKISGIGVSGRRWTPELNRTVIRDAVAIFGVERAMFGSNFPVDSLVGTFDEIYDGFAASIDGFDEASKRRLFCDNALAVYKPKLRTEQTT